MPTLNKKFFVSTNLVRTTSMTNHEHYALLTDGLDDCLEECQSGILIEYFDSVEDFLNPALSPFSSWTSEELDPSYTQIDQLTFGLALEALKLGCKVARTGWNAKNMWLSLSNPTSAEVSANQFWTKNNVEYAESLGGTATVLPCITMKTATGEILMGWLASQTDMLSNDWVIVS